MITLTEAAERFGVTRDNLAYRVLAGHLPYINVGGIVRLVRPEDVARCLAEHPIQHHKGRKTSPLTD